VNNLLESYTVVDLLQLPAVFLVEALSSLKIRMLLVACSVDDSRRCLTLFEVLIDSLSRGLLLHTHTHSPDNFQRLHDILHTRVLDDNSESGSTVGENQKLHMYISSSEAP
jgi:hypothetical protein